MAIPIVWTMDLAGQECQTTSEMSDIGGDPSSWATAMATFWTQGLAKSMSNQLSLVSVKVGVDLFATSAVGGIIQAPENASTAAIINKVTSGKPGRFFMPGVPQDAVLPDGQLLGSWKATALGQLSAALGVLNGAGYDLVVVNSLGVERSVTDLSISNVVGIQGRRRFGR